MKTFSKRLALALFSLAVCGGAVAHADEFYRGRLDAVPREFRNPRFVYDGWRERGLPQPAQGQVWIHVCDSYILTTLRTGRVAQVHRMGQSRIDQQPGFRLSETFSCMQGGRYGYRSRYRPFD